MSILCARKQLFLYVQPWLFHSFALPLLLKIGIKHEGTDYQHQRTGRGRSGSLTETERRTQQQWTESQNVGSPQGDRRPDGRGNARKLRQRIHFLWERWCVFWHLHFQRDHLFELDLANAGTDITTLPAFREADVIQLEWINQGMLSLASIRKILRSGKPVVWTLHDLWPATGICHVTLGCRAYMGGCHRCKYLPQPQNGKDLAARIFNRKKALYEGSNIHFIACSKWLGAQAKQSGLLKG